MRRNMVGNLNLWDDVGIVPYHGLRFFTRQQKIAAHGTGNLKNCLVLLVDNAQISNNFPGIVGY